VGAALGVVADLAYRNFDSVAVESPWLVQSEVSASAILSRMKHHILVLHYSN
jgi:hypothetical protein